MGARALRENATPAKRALWGALRRSQLGTKFSRQMQIGQIYADFFSRELDLIVECDGISHDREPDRDARRDAWLRGQGYTVLCFTNAELLGNLESVGAAIRLQVAALRKARPTPNPSCEREERARP